MSLEILTMIFIGTNLISLWGEIPNLIIFFALGVLFLGFFSKRLPYQSVLKVILLFISILLIRASFQKVSSAEAAISFVLALSALKFWELQGENDHFNMFLILCLSEAGIFLLNPSFVLFVLGSLKILFYFYYILKLRKYDLSSLSFKRLFILIFPSVLFSLVLFYTFPRFTQGFLNTAGNLPQIQSGFSETIDIKNLGPMNLSNKRVFKVYLNKSSLKPSVNIYWRQSVLWDYYDGTWRKGERNLRLSLEAVQQLEKNLQDVSAESLRFVIDDPVGTELITLDQPQSIIKNTDLEFRPVYFYDKSIRSPTNLRAMVQYEAFLGKNELNQIIDPLMLKKSTRIKLDPKLIPDIQKKFLSSIDEGDSAEIKVQKISEAFSKNNFIYSLNPPPYSSTENFLLSGKSGYCSHFASAFATLTRLSGIPTRLVSGYLGSEYNNFDHSLIIKELDAHVWIEVYLQQSGWTKIDPTELVNPARIQLSAEDFNNQQGQAFAFPKISFLNSAGLWIDAINSRFNESLFGYDQNAQENFFQIGFLKNIKVHNLFIVSFLLIIATYLIFFSFFKKNLPPHKKRYEKFLKKMKRFGLEKASYETATQFMERCLHNKELDSKYIKQETEAFIQLQYEKFVNF